MAKVQGSNQSKGANSVVQRSKGASFWNHARLYLLEYSFRNVALVVWGIMLIAGCFSLFSIWSDGAKGVDLDWLAWLFGVVLVFAPAAAILYARTSGEEVRNPDKVATVGRKVAHYMTLAIALISLACLGVTFVYTGSRFIFGAVSSKSLVTVTLPALLATLLNFYVVAFILKDRAPSRSERKTNIAFLTFISTALLAIVIITAFTVGAGRRNDNKIESDLSLVAEKIEKYVDANDRLPGSVDDLDVKSEIKDDFKSGKYNYNNNGPASSSFEEDGYGSEYRSSYENRLNYELCATFKTNSDNYRDYYKGYLSSSHDKGYQCLEGWVYLTNY